MTNGCFDILHIGHIELLKHCYQLSKHEGVLVALDSDRRIRELKGETRPINCFEDRKRMLLAIRYVRWAKGFDTQEELLQLIETYEPSYLVQGPPVRTPNPAKQSLMDRWDGKISFMPDKLNSTTNLIRHLDGTTDARLQT